VNFMHNRIAILAIIARALTLDSARHYFHNQAFKAGGNPIYQPKRKKYKPSHFSHGRKRA